MFCGTFLVIVAVVVIVVVVVVLVVVVIIFAADVAAVAVVAVLTSTHPHQIQSVVTGQAPTTLQGSHASAKTQY